MKNRTLNIYMSIALICIIGCHEKKPESFRRQNLPSGRQVRISTFTLVQGGPAREDSIMIHCFLEKSEDQIAKINTGNEIFELVRQTCENMDLNRAEVYIFRTESMSGDYDLIAFSRTQKEKGWVSKVNSGVSIGG